MSPLDIEARLIEAVRVFERMERKGRAFATDGPWHLMRMLPSDTYARGGVIEGRYSPGDDLKDAGERLARTVTDPFPDRDMIARAEEAGHWLRFVPEGERRLFATVIRLRAARVTRGLWLEADQLLGRRGAVQRLSGEAIRKRYTRALVALAGRVGAVTRGSEAINPAEMRT